MNQLSDPDAAKLPLSAIAEALPDPAIITGADLRVLAFNTPALGVAPLLRIGLPLPMAVRTPDVLEAASRIAGGGAAERVSWHERVPLETKMDVHVAPMRGDGQTYIAIIFRDVSAALRVERMRSDFVANASHELRTPLASMLGFVETLQGPAKNDAAAREKFLGIMREQGRRMARLLDDLLQLSRIEQSLHIAPRDSVDLAGVVRHVAETLSPSAEAAGVDVHLDVPAVLEIPGARDELIQVAENLIENAIKYGTETRHPPPRIEVKLSAEGKRAVLSVRDYGAGIAPEHLPRLTERFYRVNASASRARGGTGLGLAIVKHIAAHHRGELSISSTPGEGSEFRVSLPLK